MPRNCLNNNQIQMSLWTAGKPPRAYHGQSWLKPETLVSHKQLNTNVPSGHNKRDGLAVPCALLGEVKECFVRLIEYFVRLPSAERPYFGPPQNMEKTLPLNRRDGSVKRGFSSNLQISTLRSPHKCNFFHSVKI